jgi:hypothetical protein
MSESAKPQNKAELLSQIEAEWKSLMDVVAKLSPEQMTTPDAGGWSPKDNLAHLTEWLKALLGYHIERRPSEEVLGLPKELAENWDFQRVNETMADRSRDRSIEDVLGQLRKKYAEVMAKLKSMPFEDLLQPRFADDPDKAPLLNFVLGNTTEHFAEHRATIEKML